MELKIGHLYPDLLNLYGDRGNIQCMVKRCQWRGIGASVKEFQLGDQIDFSQLDIVLLGGGSDREQRIVCEKLKTIREDFQSYVEDMGVVLAVCGGYQLLGHYYDTDQGRIEGLSLADLYTEQGSPRLISNIIIENEDFEMPFVGFENHGGRTYTGDLKPLGKVLFGCGNNGKDGQEGILYKNSGNLPARPSPAKESSSVRLSSEKRAYEKIRTGRAVPSGGQRRKRSKSLYQKEIFGETVIVSPKTVYKFLSSLKTGFWLWHHQKYQDKKKGKIRHEKSVGFCCKKEK